MTVHELVAADAFVLTAADEEVELRALCRALTLGDGFSLLFSRCNQADHRRELIDKVREKLPDLNVQVVELREPINHLLDELRDRLTDTMPDALFVLGLEYSLRTSDEARSSPLIANLNASRNSFPRVVRSPMVLWVPQYIVTAIAHGAPDFFSILSGLYSFAASPNDSMNVVQSMMAGDWLSIQNLSLAEKQERVESIKSLLADYESPPGEKRDISTEARLHHRLGDLLSAVGSNDEALAHFLASLSIFEELGSLPNVAVSLHEIGMIRQDRGEYDAALKLYERSLKIAEELGDRIAVSRMQHQIGMIYQYRGDYEAALKLYMGSLKIAEELGDRPGMASSLHQIAIIHQYRGEQETALELCERSMRINEELGNLAGVAISLHQTAMIQQYRGDYETARQLYERSLKVNEELGNRLGVAKALQQIGNIDYLRGEYEAALDLYQRSLKLTEELGNRQGVASSLHQIGMIQQGRGDYETALEHYERSLKIAEELGDRVGVAASLHQIAKIHEHRSEYPESFQLLCRALAILVELGSPDARIAQDNLKALRGNWGEENFDAAWQQAHDEPVPDWLK